MRRWTRKCQRMAVTLACISWLFPTHCLRGNQPQRPIAGQEHHQRLSCDVQLAAGGKLVGQLVDEHGQVLPQQPVLVRQAGHFLAPVITDDQGRFQVLGVRGGTLELISGRTVQVCRAWTPGTAPPSANGQLLLVSSDPLARGQRPMGELFQDPLLIGLIIAAAIAIPIAVHNSKDDRPSGS